MKHAPLLLFNDKQLVYHLPNIILTKISGAFIQNNYRNNNKQYDFDIRAYNDFVSLLI